MAGELILIVEDNEKNRRLVRDVLQFKGYRTLEAGTAGEGLSLAIREIAIQQFQGLRRVRTGFAPRAAYLRVRRVENFHEGQAQVPFRQQINRTPIMLVWAGRDRPLRLFVKRFN